MTVQFPEFTDRVVLVTGAGSGMGKRLRSLLQEREHKIVVNDIDEKALDR